MNFLELSDLILCGLVSKRIRSVSFIESLWQKVNISTSENSRKIVPTDFVKTIINRGCKHLSLTGCKVMGNLNYSDFSLDSNYWSSDQKEKYAKIVNQIKIAKNLKANIDSSSDCETNLTKSGTSKLISLDLTLCDINHHVMNVLITACHSLKKLSLRKTEISPKMFQMICNQNGQTLETLDLIFIHGINGYPGINNEFLPSIKNCVRLKEVDFSGCKLSDICLELLVHNLSPNVKKLSFAYIPSIKDKHIAVLVSRCDKITFLNLALNYMLTDISLTSIRKNLKLTLEELDMGHCRKITHTKLLEMRSMPKLKAVNYMMPWAQEIFKELKKTMPQLTNIDPRSNYWGNLAKMNERFFHNVQTLNTWAGEISLT